MKKMNVLMLLVSLCFSSFAFSSEPTPVSSEKAALVLKALNNPSNPTGLLLKAALTNSNGTSLAIDPSSVMVHEIAPNSYQAEFRVAHPEHEESSLVTIEEVLVQNDQAYVFRFSVERSLKMRKHPGVSMGNR